MRRSIRPPGPGSEEEHDLSNDFRKPFAAPPTIFFVCLLAAVPLELVLPLGMRLPLLIQFVFGPLALLAGVLLIRSSIREVEAAGTTYDPYAQSTELVTTGIYQYTRNPGYLGLAVIQLGVAILFDSGWIALTGLAAVMITTFFVIRLEEEKLSTQFGQDYQNYCNRVRRWL